METHLWMPLPCRHLGRVSTGSSTSTQKLRDNSLDTMYDLPPMLALGFAIGLTRALARGPTLVVTIKASLSGDWTTGQ
ncbi:MAG: hypothetical protein METHP_00857 [Methanoregula sp. SKADARSKE-2]|nr:MAG: hypothetical protein METHP_00857 [Methanoregula sp. SKADARSKE-2]